MVENNKRILKKANEAISRGDHEEFLKFCTEDTVWTFIGDRKLIGKEAVRKYMAASYINPPKFDMKNLIAENDFVTVVGNITLPNEEGKMTDYAYCDVWRFRDGKMAELMAFVIEQKY